MAYSTKWNSRRKELSVTYSTENLLKFLFPNWTWYAILYASGTKQSFILFVEHFYFEYDGGTTLQRLARIRASSRWRLTVCLPPLPAEIELYDQVRKIFH